jgi:hypothetical protein
MKYYIGLDLGANGGVAVLRENGELEELFKNPDTVTGWIEKLSKYKDLHCFCLTEKVHSQPINGGKANFSFGKTVGITLTLVEVNSIPFQEITPQTWLKGYMMKKEKGETNTSWKNRLKNKAQQLFPKVKMTLWAADAVLIAEYCRRNYK